MGDVIHCLPAVASLKHSFPHSHLSWVIKPQWAPLLEGNPSVDEVIPFTRTREGIGQLWRKLRNEGFDIAVDLQGLIQSAIVAASAKAEKVVGLARSEAREPLACIFYSTRVTTTTPGEPTPHRVLQYLAVALAAGATNPRRTFAIPQGTPEGNLPEGRFVLACPLAGWGSKQWPAESWAALAKAISREFGMPLVVNGPPGKETELRAIQGAEVHLSGIGGLIDATRRATAVIGVDSGPMHLAAALGKPGVAIFGPTDPQTHGPYGGSLRVLRHAGAVTSYKRDPEIAASMRAISPEQVVAALRGALAGSAEEGGKEPGRGKEDGQG